MTLPLTVAERTEAGLQPSAVGWIYATAIIENTPENDAALVALQASLASVETQVTDLSASTDAGFADRPLMRAVFLYDTLANLEASDRHGPDTYGLVISGDRSYKSNGVDTWELLVEDAVELAAQNSVIVLGDLDVAAGTAYLSSRTGKNMTYGVIGDEIV